ncbi:N-methyltransferase tcpN [Lachnellula suecica]|uniref:N-methyltransferase tcpN n=1 Tax=Lachnellula suecica TaxID=602035 RepID=A0A8T9CG39_9HELO|nr:N-methyltransferase tcpN [Lachnellula suecica]
MGDEPKYLLIRGMYPSIRLNLQHYLWKYGLGYNLHPQIPLTGANCKIADLGTGTGIWLLDLAQQVPDSTQLYGFDISDSQYPHEEHLPRNVHLSVLDHLSPNPPIELQGIFDVVHLRLFLGNVPGGDPTGFLKHALKLLRPGGYIQWDEFDPLRGVAEGAGGEPSPEVEKILKFMQTVKDHSWVERLPVTFKEFGLDNIEVVFAHEQLWQRKMASEMSCSVIDEMEQSKHPVIAGKLKALGISVPMAFSEVMQGARITQPFCVAIGRKPFKAG